MTSASSGSVLADIQAIQKDGIDLNRAQQWAMALKSLYRLSFNDCNIILQDFRVIGVCDFFATSRAFSPWIEDKSKARLRHGFISSTARRK